MKKYILNLLWMLGDRVSMLVFQLYVFSSIKRLYDLNTLGSWSTINNLSQILMSVFMLGIDIVVIKRIVENNDGAGKEIGSAFFIQIIGMVVYSLIFFFIVITFYNNIERGVLFYLVFVLSNFFSIFAKTIFWHYSALVESKYRAVTIISSILISFSITYTLVQFKTESIFYALAIYYFIQCIIAIAIYFIFFKKKVAWAFERSTSLMYFKIGSKLIISTLSVAIFVQADTLLLEKLVGVDEVGIFNAALRISTIWFFVAGIIANAFFPKIVGIKNDPASSMLMLRWMTGVVLFLTVFASIVVMIFGQYMITFLYGSDMRAAYHVLSIHIWSSVFVFMGAFSSKWLYANNEINLDIAKTFIAALFNVIVNWFVIPKYGAIGASYVSLLSYFIANLLFFVFVTRTHKILISQLYSFKYFIFPSLFIKDFKRVKCLFQS